MIEGSFLNGKQHGKFVEYHSSGKKKAEGIWKDNQEYGKWTFWNEDGSKSREGHFRNGKSDGIWTVWEVFDGKLMEGKGLVIKGKKQGKWNYYYQGKDGTAITKEIEYKLGVPPKTPPTDEIKPSNVKFSLSETTDLNFNPPKRTKIYGTVTYQGCVNEVNCSINDDSKGMSCNVICKCIGKGADFTVPHTDKNKLVKDVVYLCRSKLAE